MTEAIGSSSGEDRPSVPVVIYARNSKPPKGWRPARPGDEPPSSWRSQIPKCRAAAERDGGAVVLEVYDMVTGRDPNRPSWDQVMAAVEGGRVRRVYATKLDRVMRSVKHFLDVRDTFQRRGAELIFTDQPGASIRKGDPWTNAVSTILAAFAELEAEIARERSMDVLEVRDDGRLYGPRSSRPAGAPKAYGPEHKMRTRDGRQWHDKARCPACRVAEPGGPKPEGERPTFGGVAGPVGSATPKGSANVVRRAPAKPPSWQDVADS